jgi:MYXO-CTERM domain-containing protein
MVTRWLRARSPLAVALAAAPAATASAGPGATSNIINGDPVGDGQFPTVVGILISTGNICTGTLVSPTAVLTAAHCVDPSVLRPEGGADDIEYHVTFERDLGVAGERLAVAGVEWHDGFPNIDRRTFEENGPKQYHDVAVIHLADPVAEERNLQPLALDGADALLTVGATYDVAGYGLTSNATSAAGVLTYGRSQLDTIGDHEIAVGDQDRQQGCRGDSGGPVMTLRGIQVGIASRINYAPSQVGATTPPCVPGLIYTRVDAYAGWIRDRVDDLPGEAGGGAELGGCGCRSGGDGAGVGALVVAAAALARARRRRA